MKISFQALSFGGELDVEPSDTIRVLKAKLSSSVGFPAGELRLALGCTVLNDDAAMLQDCSIAEGSVISALRSQGWDRTRLESLKELFVKHGELHSEPAAEFLRHDASLPAGLELPASLKELLCVAAKWNFTKGSCDVFDCNICLNKPGCTEVFGGEAEREEWKDGHKKDCGGESCAGEGWACICASSEYDYYFVNLRKDSPQFGATRHIVNNANEERVFTDAPFERFLDVVEAYAKANAVSKPDHFESFSDFRPCKKGRTD